MTGRPHEFFASGIFAGLDVALQRDLYETARLGYLTRGQWLLGEGNRIDHPALIVSGTAGIYRSAGSRSVLIGIVGAGVSIGQIVMSADRVQYSAVCRSDVIVARFPSMEAVAQGGRTERLAKFLLRLQAKQMGTSLQRTADRLSLPPLARVAAELHYLRGQFHSDDIEVTQDELAEMIGLSRKTVNRCLGRLGHAAVVSTRYASVYITDAATLSRFATSEL